MYNNIDENDSEDEGNDNSASSDTSDSDSDDSTTASSDDSSDGPVSRLFLFFREITLNNDKHDVNSCLKCIWFITMKVLLGWQQFTCDNQMTVTYLIF